MKVFWNDCGRGPDADGAKVAELDEVQRIWADEVRGVKGNFLGLIDDQDNTVQFYFDEGIPDGVDDASHLPVLLDFPVPEKGGSYQKHVKNGVTDELIDTIFTIGADYRQFQDLKFVP